MLPRNPRPPSEPPAPKKRSARYVVEIRDAAGGSLLLTSADWTDSERDMAMSSVLKLVGFKPAAPAKRKGDKARGDPAQRAKEPQKK
jgi:hypothetical protein